MIDLTKPLQTRDGRPVRILSTDVKNSFYPIIGIVTGKDGEEYPDSWTSYGKNVVNTDYEDEDDLVNVNLLELEAKTDDAAVDAFATKMKARLAEKRAEGRTGWSDPDKVSDTYLVFEMLDRLAAGSFIGVANFCMMLDHREAPASLPRTCMGHLVRNGGVR